jgi:two-component system OmpR family response regulator
MTNPPVRPVPHVLIVDDDQDIRQLISEYLSKNQYQTSTLPSGEHLFDTLKKQSIDILILDLMMPGTDGLELCKQVRAHSTLPIIMLTAKGDETDRIIGLELGADDYLPKPFNPRELLARIKSVLRRSHQERTNNPLDPNHAEKIIFSGWTLDLQARHLVSPNEVVVSLSGAEFRLLKIFLSHPHQILSRDQLLNITKGRDAHPFDRSIDVQISRLRQRLNDDTTDESNELIKTVRGEGYVLSSQVDIIS